MNIVLAVLALRRRHYSCGDPYYSCPLADDSLDDPDTAECDCGADEQNKRIDIIVAELRRMGIGEAAPAPAPAKPAEKTWRTDYETYLKECEAAFDAQYEDWVWIARMREFYPKAAIRRTLELMFEQYWGTEAGWKNKRAKRTATIDWKATIQKNFKHNRVYWGRDEVDTEAATLQAKGLL